MVEIARVRTAVSIYLWKGRRKRKRRAQQAMDIFRSRKFNDQVIHHSNIACASTVKNQATWSALLYQVAT
jgi:hypothetical protein